MGKFPRKVRVYLCPNCSEPYEYQSEAENCCFNEIEEVDHWQCIDCDQIHEFKEDAYGCCS